MTTPTPTLGGHAQHMFLAKVLDVEGYWTALTGGEPSLTVTEQYDGGDDVPDLIPSRGTVSNLVLRRPFKPTRDMRWEAEFRAKLLSGYFRSIVLQPLGRDGKAIGDKFTWTNCLLLRPSTPGVDRNSDTGSMWETEWRPPRAAVIGQTSNQY